MTMIQTDSTLVLINRMIEILDPIKATIGPLGIKSVWFGDQMMVPDTPSLCIEPGRMRRSLAGIPDLTDNFMDLLFLLYHAPIKETQAGRKEAIQTAEALERYLHVNHFNMQNASGDQIIVYGMFTDRDPGYTYKAGTLYSAVQMTWTAYTKTSVRNPS